jgi:RES domain-containing protein
MSAWALKHPYLTAFVVIPAFVSGAVNLVAALRGKETSEEKLAKDLEKALQKKQP